MQFVLIAKDGMDIGALQRRLDARAAHSQNTDDNMPHMKMGAATLGEDGNMNGSVMVVEFESREALDAWLEKEPYVTQGVWKDIEILPCRIGPSFLK
jgi:hypothetical protein